MALPSTLNPEAPIFIPAHLAPITTPDLTTTTVLLNYFSHLGATLTSNEPSGRSAPVPVLPYRSNHTAARAAQREFTYYYGEDANNLAAWQALLSTCAFEAIPDTLEECKQLFNTIHVNIFNLVEATRLGLKTRSFLYARDLAVYSRAMGRVCPLSVAKEDTLFRAVLRKFG